MAPSPLQITEGSVVVNRSSVAALAFLVWDILITLSEEIRLIWPRQVSATKLMFFVVRYIPLSVEIAILFVGTTIEYSHHACFIWQMFQGVASIVIVAAVDYILILRVHALYHGNRNVKAMLWTLYALEFAGMIVGVALAVPRIEFTPVCLNVFVPSTILIYGITSLVFQAVLFGLTTVQFVRALRSGWRRDSLVSLIMRDGTWAFFLIFTIFVASALLSALPNPADFGVVYGWILTVFSFCGYRVVLNLHRFSTPLPERSSRMDAIEFRTPTTSNKMTAGTSESHELSHLRRDDRV